MSRTTTRTRSRSGIDRTEQRAEAMCLLRRMRALPADDPRHAELREDLIADHMVYARHLAHHYARGTDSGREDIEQVAYLGLVKAVDGFNPEFGTGFLGYATPMIIGEIKRHYRDNTWDVHVPRRMQELTHELHQANDKLTLEFGHAPTLGMLGEYLGITQDELVQALDASDAYHAGSIDRPVGDGEDSASVGELIGVEDPGFDRVVDLQVLRGLVAELDERDKRVLMMRFFRSMTQAQIGDELGLSQMHISRLIAGLMARLRAGFE